jgi:regulator of replication initiation timing
MLAAWVVIAWPLWFVVVKLDEMISTIEDLEATIKDLVFKNSMLKAELYNMKTCIGEYMETFKWVGIEELKDKEESEEENDEIQDGCEGR